MNPFAAAAAMAPPLFSRTSPRSPKGNPFSSPSPTPNPFMSFGSKGTNYWSKLNTNTAANTGNTASTDVGNTGGGADGAGGKDDKRTLDTPGDPSAVPPPAPPAEAPPASEDADPDSDKDTNADTSAPPSPPSPVGVLGGVGAGDVCNGEQLEECVLQLRAKLFRLCKRPVPPPDSDRSFPSLTGNGDRTKGGEKEGEDNSKDKVCVEWVEMGTGPVRVLRPSEGVEGEGEVKPLARLVMRRESQAGGVGKLIRTSLCYPQSLLE